MKGAILDWITSPGSSLRPPLARNIKIDRGFHHEVTAYLLRPADYDWSDPEYAYKLSLTYVYLTVQQDKSPPEKRRACGAW